MEFFTIGVYNFTEQEFFDALKENRIDMFCDIRQRRGVRGSKYAFANSKRLQNKLVQLNIKYMHLIKLAPSKEIRNIQKQGDLQAGAVKRTRNELGSSFLSAYKHQVLEHFDFDNLIENLEQQKANRVVLFCVEAQPQACHRSIVSNKLQEKYQYNVTHL